jgi:hypothetical protein
MMEEGIMLGEETDQTMVSFNGQSMRQAFNASSTTRSEWVTILL